MKIHTSSFGQLEGKEVIKFTLDNHAGVKVEVIT